MKIRVVEIVPWAPEHGEVLEIIREPSRLRDFVEAVRTSPLIFCAMLLIGTGIVVALALVLDWSNLAFSLGLLAVLVATPALVALAYLVDDLEVAFWCWRHRRARRR